MSNGPPSRDRRSLQDLAKLASSPNLSPSSSRTPAPPSTRTSPPSSGRPSSPEHDSGIVDLKIIAKSDEAGAERAKTTPLASAGLFDEEMPSVAPPPLARTSDPPPSGKVPSSPPSSAQAAKAPGAAKAALAAPQSQPKSGGMLIPVLAGLGLAAIATGLFMVTRPPAPAAPKAVETPAQVPAAAAAAVEKAAPAPPAAASPAPAAAPETHAETTAAGNDAPKTVAGPAGARRVSGPGAKKVAATENAGGGSSVSELSAMMAHATNSPAAPAPVNATAGNLGEAVQNAVGGGGAAPAPAAPAAPSGPQFAPGSVPEKPSQGAVTSALSQALPQARNCLNQDDPVSKANVTFGSTGGVTAVVVTGSAAGKPAEGCIKSALMKASVPPFAQATYSANVTVRPN